MEYYFISDFYMGEKLDDGNWPKNFADGFNGIMLKGIILEENAKIVLFRIGQILNFELRCYNELPNVGDVIKIEWSKKHNSGEYYQIDSHPFDTDISVLCSKECYEKNITECKFGDFNVMLRELKIDNKYEKDYLIKLLRKFIKDIK